MPPSVKTLNLTTKTMQFLYSPAVFTAFNPFTFPCFVLLIALVLLFQWSRRHLRLFSGIEKHLLLPPGSMGWPYVGETLKLFTQNPNSFFSTRQKRYGDIFKTHILGCPCVMITNPEAAKIVLVKKAHLFKPTYPPTKEKMIGSDAIFFHQGQYHSKLKKLIISSFSPSAIKDSVPQIEDIVLKMLPFWDINYSINTLQEMKKYAFDVAILSAFGDTAEVEVKGIKNLYHCLEKGYNSMPCYFPWSSFHKALKARSLLTNTLWALIRKRRESGNSGGGLLGVLLNENTNAGGGSGDLSDNQIADNIIGVIFAAHDTTASALTWVLKYLYDNPLVLETVTKEQEEIRKKRKREEKRGLTWSDTRGMKVTSRVIQETLRMASILSFTYREAVEDVEFEGYVIPKGWKVLPVFRSIHHSPDFYPRPQLFDPSRFEVAPRPNTYMPFGNGVHSCPGSDLAKLEIFILLHHLTTSYRWEVIGSNEGIEYGPFPVPNQGLPIRVLSRK